MIQQALCRAIMNSPDYKDIVKRITDLKFDDREIAIMRLYNENYTRLQEARLIENGFPIFKGFHYSVNTQLEFNFSDFELRDIPELLHLLRPFLLHRERASFDNTKNIFGKRANKDNLLCSELKKLQKLYMEGYYRKYGQISIINLGNDIDRDPNKYLGMRLGFPASNNEYEKIPLFDEKTIQKWLNGMEYHQDTDKRLFVKKIEKVLGKDIAKRFFVSQLFGKILAISILKGWIYYVISE
ncbi:hypothetical protein [Baaleninema simplex]|uniref:hypothetical protein n=1 Tax=Baaleninema simplex TaxID=2862350 RepID=UPI0011819163|nr:hypothetical protein [Baaleninema simplex]